MSEQITNEKLKEMIDATNSYMTPRGNMESRENAIVRSFKQRMQWEQVCWPGSILKVLEELSQLRETQKQDDETIEIYKEAIAFKNSQLHDVDQLRTRNAELEAENARLKKQIDKDGDGYAAAVTLLMSQSRAVELDNKRLRDALENIKWHREPGGSPSKYQYEVEVIADRALQSPPVIAEVDTWRLATYDEGGYVFLSSHSGGAAPEGSWGHLTIGFSSADGVVTFRDYLAGPEYHADVVLAAQKEGEL